MFDIEEFLRTFKVLYYSGKNNDEYLQLFIEKISKAEISGNFMPDFFDSPKEAMKSLRIIVEDLNIRDLRIGFRWNKIEPQAGQISLDYYLPFLNYCLENKVKICLNVGPIKTIGWPEEHIPEWVLKKFDLPGNSVISDQSELGKTALEYFNDLLTVLDNSLYLPRNSLIYSLQPENESFNRFGQFKLISSEEYINESIKMLYSKYPKKEIMLNSSGLNSAGQIFSIFKQFPGIKGVLGLNYYYTYPGRKNFIYYFIEPFSFNPLAKYNVKQAARLFHSRDYKLEISEAQMDPWGEIKTPGNSVHSLRFVLGKCLAIIQKNQEYNSKIRLWGLERFSLKYLNKQVTEEHQKMAKLIRLVHI